MEKIYNEIIISKTPASWIQEICAKEGQIPRWEITDLLLSERRIPSFRCVLTVNFRGQELTADVEAEDKKIAKHAAATVMLNEGMKLTPRDYYEISRSSKRISAPPSSPLNPPIEPPSVEATAAANKIIIIDVDVKSNVVQDLLLHCHSLKWGEPIYSDFGMVGPPHDRTFEVTCTIEGQTMSEKSKTKKQAKKRVAYKWFLFLNSNGSEDGVKELAGDVGNSTTKTNESRIQQTFLQLPDSFEYIPFDKIECKKDIPQKERRRMELKRSDCLIEVHESGEGESSLEVSSGSPEHKKRMLTVATPQEKKSLEENNRVNEFWIDSSI